MAGTGKSGKTALFFQAGHRNIDGNEYPAAAPDGVIWLGYSVQSISLLWALNQVWLDGEDAHLADAEVTVKQDYRGRGRK